MEQQSLSKSEATVSTGCRTGAAATRSGGRDPGAGGPATVNHNGPGVQVQTAKLVKDEVKKVLQSQKELPEPRESRSKRNGRRNGISSGSDSGRADAGSTSSDVSLSAG